MDQNCGQCESRMRKESTEPENGWLRKIARVSTLQKIRNYYIKNDKPITGYPKKLGWTNKVVQKRL